MSRLLWVITAIWERLDAYAQEIGEEREVGVHADLGFLKADDTLGIGVEEHAKEGEEVEGAVGGVRGGDRPDDAPP